MLTKNSLAAGVIAAFIFPVIAYGASIIMKNNADIINRPALPYLIAILINLILIRLCLRRELDLTGRGIMLATFVIMLLVFIFKVNMR